MLIPTLALALVLQEPPEPESLSAEDLRAAGRVAGLELTDAELELMLAGVRRNLASYERMRAAELDNGVAPMTGFSASLDAVAAHLPRNHDLKAVERGLPEVERPADLEELAYADIPTLASLIRSRKVSCVELTQMYLARLERLDDQLECVITLTEERALAQAKALDAELAEGKWRGMLHGIPWGAKDLLATEGYRTTWGAKPFEDQIIPYDATVVERLDAAGAVLVAKLTLGALAWGDVWYDGRTRNPWNLDQGSSGSSAGPASATAAGCVAFSIGSETCGSIVSPSARCGNSSLRPTYGRVSRHGAMALSWSMDKLGPICRSVGDAAIVFAAIEGPDPRDDHLIARDFTDLGPADVTGLRVGFVPGTLGDEDAELERLASLEGVGLVPVPVELPTGPAQELFFVLSVEAAAAFDDLTRDGRDEQLVRQVEQAWPNVFRQSRLVPAVEYLRANRLRRRLTLDWVELLDSVDVLVHPSSAHLVALNLTGHPSVVVPTELRENGTPRSLCFTGQLFEEDRLLAVAEAWQRSTGFHLVHPDL